ncbi:PBP1A family penicillin-binding protein [Brucella melitensis]|uniref:penicillin-binding protein 1A n=1 Tax=Brucella melitensis TaxID=29459 RepID=UPI000B9D5CDB|nr:penicillin-binding protein 1A [Brucella melitensis]ASU65979.1 penicillin-binding protein [Brucella melitensis]MWC14767.1 PBP1A family penicillin-binding protein [Brucella melitensis]MWC21357.1 PBP1A family penicillin-binding protein [Brucella melitensis]MWC33958.1 PBP1A family penicillin-binding protein [Brucella melitensis]
MPKSVFMRNTAEKDRGNDKRKPFRVSRLIGLDAWIDSALYNLHFHLGEWWENITIFSRRFRVRGFRRFTVEVLDEGFTLGVAGSVLMLMLALPAFEETKKDWRAQDDYAVTFLDRYGNEIGRRGILHRQAVPIDELPDHVIKAVLGTEDRRFFDHYGIDLMGLSRALSQNMRANGVVQGGSTITQQLAKNLFLSNERTIERKVKEAFLALWLESNLSKKEILQLYLDRAYMGGGTFGIAAASEFYFGKNVKDISLAEAAMLAGLFKAPAKFAPHVNLPAARARANVVLSNMVESGFLSEGQVAVARRHPASVIDRAKDESPDYFLDWAFDEVKKVADRFNQHTLIVRTTLDRNIQKAAEESLEFHLRQYGKEYNVSEAATVVLANDGSVRALVGGRDYGESQFNRATRALRQAGSSFKPYVYAAAMEKGLTPSTIVSDAPISWGNWSPRNYGRSFAGRVDLTTALVRSLNSVPVRLARDYLTTAPVVALTKAMGVESHISSHKTMVLGTSEMTVMDQATGFNVFANAGMAGNRHAFTQILASDGKVLWDFGRDAPKPHRALSEKAALEMNSMLVQVPERGTGRRAALTMTRVAGKTGTTQNYRDAWFVGFTGNFTAAVWFGNDNFTPMKELTGGVLPAMAWQRMMAYAHQNIELKPLPGVNPPFPAQPKNPPAQVADTRPHETMAAPPRVLSPLATKILKELHDRFLAAPPLPTIAERTKVSVL